MNLNKVERSSVYFLLLKMQIVQSKEVFSLLLTLVCQPDLEKKIVEVRGRKRIHKIFLLLSSLSLMQSFSFVLVIENFTLLKGDL